MREALHGQEFPIGPFAFEKLDNRHVFSMTRCPEGRPQGGGGLAFAVARIHNDPPPGTETTLSLRTGTALAADGKAVITLGTSVSSEHFVVHANTKEVGEQTLVLAENAWDQLAHHFRHLPSDGVVILVVEDDSEFDAIQPAPRTRGFATYGGNRIYLRGRDVDQE